MANISKDKWNDVSIHLEVVMIHLTGFGFSEEKNNFVQNCVQSISWLCYRNRKPKPKIDPYYYLGDRILKKQSWSDRMLEGNRKC